MNAIQKSSFGNIDEIVDIQGRIQSTYTSLFPNSATLTNDEAFALAQVGYMQGLDVFNKEIYYLKQVKNGETKAIGVMPGIRGLRKHAHRQIRYEGGKSANFWFEFFMIIDKEEKAKAGAGDTDLVVKALLRDTVTMQSYLSMRQTIFSNHSSWSDLLKLTKDDGSAVATVTRAIEDSAKEILGTAPIITSYGIVKNYELKKDGTNLVRPLQMINTQNPYYMAEIRAERRGLYKRFDLEKNFGVLEEDKERIVESVDAEFEEAEQSQEPTNSTEKRSVAQNLAELGFS